MKGERCALVPNSETKEEVVEDMKQVGGFTGSGDYCEGTTDFVSARSKFQQIESLRDVVGDYGIALFVPLLDFVYSANEDSANVRSKTSETVTTSSSSTTLASHSELDQYHSESDDKNVDELNDYIVDERKYILETVQVVPESISQIKACPPIISKQHMQYLQHFLPYSIHDYIWERRFVIGLHGDSFCTLLQRCEGYKNSIVVVRTTTNQILGGYASEEWRICTDTTTNQQNRYRTKRHSYYGTGQSFIFGTRIDDNHRDQCDSVIDAGSTQLCVYPWTGQNDYCQICDIDKSVLCMGGVGDFGWIISDNFTLGQTGSCATYNNPPLIDHTSFCIADFEIYGLISPIAQFL